ncbi:MAG: hypothetical protein WDO73_34520 [Ignavibacteriota bacterium]
MHFDAEALKWSSEPDGSHRAQVDLAAATFDDGGTALAAVNTTFPLTLTAQQYPEAVQRGLVYRLTVQVSKPGPYLVRAALRDPATDGSGAAEQFVEVPDLAGGHLALSGIVVQETTLPSDPDVAQGPAPRVDLTGGGARRVFHRGSSLAYIYEILNGSGSRPELDVQTRVFRDGASVIADRKALNASGEWSDPQHLRASGH